MVYTMSDGNKYSGIRRAKTYARYACEFNVIHSINHKRKFYCVSYLLLTNSMGSQYQFEKNALLHLLLHLPLLSLGLNWSSKADCLKYWKLSAISLQGLQIPVHIASLRWR